MLNVKEFPDYVEFIYLNTDLKKSDAYTVAENAWRRGLTKHEALNEYRKYHFAYRETCICLTSDIHELSKEIGYLDYISPEDIMRSDISTFESLMKRDTDMINTLIETFREDFEEIEDEDIQSEITEMIERLEELKENI